MPAGISRSSSAKMAYQSISLPAGHSHYAIKGWHSILPVGHRCSSPVSTHARTHEACSTILETESKLDDDGQMQQSKQLTLKLVGEAIALCSWRSQQDIAKLTQALYLTIPLIVSLRNVELQLQLQYWIVDVIQQVGDVRTSR